MPVKTEEMLVCRESFVDLDYAGQRYVRGVTRVYANDPMFKRNPSWRKFFEPAGVSYPIVETATAVPGEFR